MKQRVLNELHAAWNKLMRWELPASVTDQLQPTPTTATDTATSAAVNTSARQPRSSSTTSTLNLSRVTGGRGGGGELLRRLPTERHDCTEPNSTDTD